MGPSTPIGKAIFETKYASPGEDYRETCNRVAASLTNVDLDYHSFRDAMLAQRFLPGGRILSSVGTAKKTTAYNCFVSGTIADSFTEGDGSIMQRATEAATTMRMGGGIGYDFSSLRPRGAEIKSLRSQASGPISFMHIFDAVCRTVSSSGHRRGAQMAILRVDHPDIEEFVSAKQNTHALSGFNVSIGITDEFMIAVCNDTDFTLRFGGQVWGSVRARQLWERIMRSTWDWGEPGVVFIDRMNRENNLYYCEQIDATNPCSEQPLPPFGACLLGSFNLTRYLKIDRPVPFRMSFDMDQLRRDIPSVVAAMDRVVDVANYPLEEQRKEALNKRRMGLGVMGVANAFEILGHSYASDSFLRLLDEVMSVIKEEAYAASANLAHTRGAFPLYDAIPYDQGNFIGTLSSKTRALIRQSGIRNSHLISVAPTGTISLLADNVSSGIEPVLMYEGMRRVIMPDGPQEFAIMDWAFANHGHLGRTADTVSAKEHISVLCTAQKHTDSAVSKTCNVPANMLWDDFKQLYIDAWRNGAKGCTTYPIDGGKRGSIMVAKTSNAANDNNPRCTEGECAA